MKLEDRSIGTKKVEMPRYHVCTGSSSGTYIHAYESLMEEINDAIHCGYLPQGGISQLTYIETDPENWMVGKWGKNWKNGHPEDDDLPPTLTIIVLAQAMLNLGGD